MAHRRWLKVDHHFRFQKDQSDGTIELRSAPTPTLRVDVLREMTGMNHVYGKASKKRTRKEVDDEVFGNDDVMEVDDSLSAPADKAFSSRFTLWKKRSIFFDLLYWKDHLLKHNLDVMHIEKNVCDNLFGTILNVDGKTKDNLKALLDLQVMGLRPELLLTVLSKLKVPDDYASNISRCVNLKERKLSNLKSHDCHILMQDILPISLRLSMPKSVVSVVSELSSFFKCLCSKTITLKDLDEMESKIAVILYEVRRGGPVHLRWMYFIERYLMELKSHVKNKAQPEGSIAEEYLAKECTTFSSRYINNVDTLLNQPQRNHDEGIKGRFLFSSRGKVLGKVNSLNLDTKSLSQAHRYVTSF